MREGGCRIESRSISKSLMILFVVLGFCALLTVVMTLCDSLNVDDDVLLVPV